MFLILEFLGSRGFIDRKNPLDPAPTDRFVLDELEKEKRKVSKEAVLKSFSEQYKNNLEILIEVCRIYEITPVLMTQPAADVGYVQKQGQDIFNQLIRDVSKEKDVFLIDLDREIPEKNRYKYFLKDNWHVNKKGSILEANIIARELARIINMD